MRTREELAWAAGLFEGEGTVRLTAGKKAISVGNTDRSVLDRFRAAVGLGKVFGPYQPRYAGAQPFYQYWVSRFEHRQAVVALLWTWLSERRRAQLAAMLEKTRAGNVANQGPRSAETPENILQ